MKKMKRLLAVLLAAALCVTPAAWSNAEELPATEAPSAEAAIVDMATNAAATEFIPFTLTTGTEKDQESKLHTYAISIPVVSDEYSSEGKLVVPVVITEKGRLFADALPYAGIPETAYTDMSLYKDAACTESVSISSSGLSYDVLDKGTYYVSFLVRENSAVSESSAYVFVAGFSLIPAGNQTLKNKTWKIIALQDSKSPVYLKITASKNSKLTVNLDTEFMAYVTLCNSKKKAISEEITLLSTDGYTAYFAVPKGTYYIKLKSSSDYLRVKATVTAAKDQTGASRASAKAISVNGSKISGFAGTNDKTSKEDWIKFTNTKTQKIVVYLEAGISSGDLEVVIYNASGKSFFSTTLNSYRKRGNVSLYTIGAGYSGKTLSKGTYYIKIKKKSAKASAAYTVQVKNK